MLAFASLAAFPLLFGLLFFPSGRGDGPKRSWEESLLLAAAVWAALAVVLAEALSALRILTQAPLAAAWGFVDLMLWLSLWLVWRKRRVRIGFLPPNLLPLDVILTVTLGLYLLLLGLVAWSSPPNNTDSLQYHMARVVHWAQQESLEHYGTAFGPQLWNPPGAEILILNLRLLAGDDQLANFVQWFTFVGVLVGVGWIGKRLGLSTPVRWVGVCFAGGIPMAVLQATSTQNDLVTAFWLVIFIGFILKTHGRRIQPVDTLALGVVLGMGLLTKATFYVFSLPFVVWFVWARPWRAGPGRTLREVVLVGALALVLNLGHVARNSRMGWTPIGPLGWLPAQTYAEPGDVPGGVLVRVLRLGLLNYATPWPAVNQGITSRIQGLETRLGVKGDSPALVWRWNDENVAGSPIHLGLLICLGLSVLFQRQGGNGRVYASCLAAGVVLLAATTSSAVDPVNIRYQLPALVLGAPLVGHAMARYLRSSGLAVAALALSILPMPWVLFNASRPLVGMQPEPGALEVPCSDTLDCTYIGSVLAVPKADILFANMRPEQEEYLALTLALEESSCRRAGLRIDSHDPEYVLWYLLDAPQSGFWLETIYAAPETGSLIDRTFDPCAIVCTVCDQRTRLHGLALAEAMGGTTLFLGDGFTWEEDG